MDDRGIGEFMKTFKDNAGRVWTISIDVSAVKRVRTLLNVNLLDVIDGKLIERLAGDIVLLCDVLFALVKPEAETKNISDEDFGRSMAGDSIEHATAAFLEELVDFFPGARRKLLAKALAKMKTWEEKAVALAEKKLESPELDAAVEKAMSTLGDSSGNSPEPSG
jgi:hypothetical protein